MNTTKSVALNTNEVCKIKRENIQEEDGFTNFYSVRLVPFS